jgi:hypothetical protein
VEHNGIDTACLILVEQQLIIRRKKNNSYGSNFFFFQSQPGYWAYTRKEEKQRFFPAGSCSSVRMKTEATFRLAKRRRQQCVRTFIVFFFQ